MKVKLLAEAVEFSAPEIRKELRTMIAEDEWMDMRSNGSNVIVKSLDGRITISVDPFNVSYLVSDEDIREVFSGERSYYILRGLERFMIPQDQIIRSGENGS